jgi:hypothetical protein
MDRRGTIWAHYLQWDHETESAAYDRMFSIDPASGLCSDAGVGLAHPGGKVFEYGLAFVRDPADPERDLLYATALQHPWFIEGAELHRVDEKSFAPTLVGPLEHTLHSYLAGTGDGRLLTMYSDETGRGILELDPATAAPLGRQPVEGLPNSQGSFVFWGGAAWVFWVARYDPDELRTDVYRVDLDTSVAELVTSVDLI